MEKRILIADDDASSRSALALALEDEGYLVVLASDGIEALEHTERASPDLVLVDLDMPRMRGEDVVRRLKQTHPDCPVAIVTASRSDDVRDEVRGLGVAGFFTKPVDLVELFDAIAEIFTPPGPRGATG